MCVYICVYMCPYMCVYSVLRVCIHLSHVCHLQLLGVDHGPCFHVAAGGFTLNLLLSLVQASFAMHEAAFAILVLPIHLCCHAVG